MAAFAFSLIPFTLLSLLLFPCLGCGNTRFIRVAGGVTALTHVRVIDGTGAPARQDQTLIIENGRIREIGDFAQIRLTGVAHVVDLRGHTVLPGLVGMHDHLFYHLPPGNQSREMLDVFPKLYLAAGVTSLRTAGTIDIDAELRFKQRIDDGKEIGPHLYLATPYIDPDPAEPENPAGYALAVEQLIPKGVQTVKVYSRVRRSELAAVIASAHRHGARATGHLCAIGFTEAAAMGIDNLEHGLIVDTEFYSRRQTGACPDWPDVVAELVQMDVRGPRIQALIDTLVKHHVAITSTLAVFESFSSARMPGLDDRAVPMLEPNFQAAYLATQSDTARKPDVMWGAMLKKEMAFERAFVKAGGLLMAGVDPTGWGGTIAGFGDQHQVELLVEAGFTPEQAIRIATYNGALFLGRADRIGTLETGKEADLFVVRGNPASKITDIRHTELVFKDGVGYDSPAILRSLTSRIGTR
jgi:imidazolonepropionase-like amidohydrolase